MTEAEDYYAILGVLPSADEVVIRAAYRALSQKYHPDKWTGERSEATGRMQQLNEAYEVLSHIERRQQYDRKRSDNTQDDFDFTDEAMRSAFQQAENDQEADWKVALEYYPDLAEIHRKLARVSDKLAFEFRSELLASKGFANRHQLAKALESRFLQRYFGTNPRIVTFARELVEAGHKKAAKELNRAVTILGSNDDPNLIGRIRGKFILYSHTAEGELLTQEAANILRELVARGHVLSVDDKNRFTLTKGTTLSHLHSNAQITRLGQILAVSGSVRSSHL